MITSSQLTLFMRLFSGRHDVYGTYDSTSGRAWQVKSSPGHSVYNSHLLGNAALAIYPLIDSSMTRFAVIDFDEPDGNLPKDAVRCAIHHNFHPLP